jgi:hypothetical protein
VSGFSSNCFRKIEAHAKVRPAMTPPIDSARATRRRTPPGGRALIVHHYLALYARDPGQKKKGLGGSAQPTEKAQFRQENPRKSKLFPLIGLARPWPGFAGFC